MKNRKMFALVLMVAMMLFAACQPQTVLVEKEIEVTTIVEKENVSQPNGVLWGQAAGETVVTTDSEVDINTGNGHMFVWPEGIALDEVVRAVNSLGASPMDLMAILQALNEAGALEAELVVI